MPEETEGGHLYKSCVIFAPPPLHCKWHEVHSFRVPGFGSNGQVPAQLQKHKDPISSLMSCSKLLRYTCSSSGSKTKHTKPSQKKGAPHTWDVNVKYVFRDTPVRTPATHLPKTPIFVGTQSSDEWSAKKPVPHTWIPLLRTTRISFHTSALADPVRLSGFITPCPESDRLVYTEDGTWQHWRN